MNGFVNTFGFFAGAGAALLLAVFAFFNRDRYKTLINDIYIPGNNELREQLATAREEIKETTSENAALTATNVEKDNTIKILREANSKQPDFTKLLTTVSDNHKEIMNQVSKSTESIINTIVSDNPPPQAKPRRRR